MNGKKGPVIVVSGQVGTGKTTHAKLLAREFNLRYVSSGQLFRELAKERGFTLEEFHRLAEKDPKIDLLVDKRALREAERGSVVIEGHLTAWIVKELADIRILLTAPLEVRAKRVAERDNITLDKALKDVMLRDESNKLRAERYYGVDLSDWTIFDLVLNTSKLTVHGTFEVLKTFVGECLKLREAAGDLSSLRD